MPFEPRRVPIGAHELFCSDETEAPFQHCLICDSALVEGQQEYVIQKAYRQNVRYGARELVFEFALCAACHTRFAERLSEESLERVQAFYRAHLGPSERLNRLLGDGEAPVASWTDRCMFDGTPREEMEEYQVVARGRGPWLELGVAPAVIGGQAIEAMSACISEKTRDEGRRFWNEHLGPSPELRALLQGGPLTVI